MANPYLITGPALISFSGGRTSAYMLKMILDAHGGTLPDDVHVCFANTGKEREETLRFVHECESRWGVRVNWLEFLTDRKRVPVAERFAIVGYNSAARNGEPFERMLRLKQRAPNSFRRFCTQLLKVQAMTDFAEAVGWQEGSYAECVGIRFDEMHRYFKLKERNEKLGRDVRAPLVKDRKTKRDVMAFWSAQPFDLQLRPSEGNCDLCFLKGRKTLTHLIARDPASAKWWSDMEALTGGPFSNRYSYADLARNAVSQPRMVLNDDDDEFDAECGLWCAGEAA